MTTKAGNPKPAAAPAKPVGPKYADLVKEAILALKERSGSSVPAIKKWLAEHHPNAKNPTALRGALKNGVSKGVLVRVKSSYKVHPDAKKPPKKAAKRVRKPKAGKAEGAQADGAAVGTGDKKKPAAKKPATKKPATKKTAAKKTTTKKPAAKKTAKPAAKKTAKPAAKKTAAKKTAAKPKKTIAKK